MEGLGFVYNRLIELAVEYNHLTGERKFKYDEIQPKLKVLRSVIEKFKKEFKDAPALLEELTSLEDILDNGEQKGKETRLKADVREPGERE